MAPKNAPPCIDVLGNGLGIAVGAVSEDYDATLVVTVPWGVITFVPIL
jgi:hypothetical protein